MRVSLLLLGAVAASADQSNAGANPIRKVVTMLQKMQKKVEAEGEKEKELFDKFMCYCKNGAADLGKSIGDTNTKIPELQTTIEESISQKAQLEEDLKKHQTDRSSAKAAMAEATALREKEAGEFAGVSTDLNTNIAALGKATAAIEKGMAGAFLQTSAASLLKKLVMSDSTTLLDIDRQDLASFLAGGSSDESGNPGAITGILKQMSDTMTKSLDEATATENAAIATYDSLIKAKTDEVNALTAAIEDKTKRVGELGVSIVQMKGDLSDSEEALIADTKFLAELKKSCSTKEAEWAVIVKSRSEEMLALADTIKILNDDDALEMFKKTLPGSSASFVQEAVSAKASKQHALALLEAARGNKKDDRQKIDFIMLAIRGKTAGFEKVIKLIDEMVALLNEEQLDDDHKKEYCEMQFDFSDDKKKELERTVGKLETAIDDAKEGIAALTSDIAALNEGIVALDKSVAEATEQRKEENSDFKTLVASDAAAKDILAFAKNRLNKFYNPKLYKPDGAASFMQISSHGKADPGPAPEAPKAFKKNAEGGTGVIAMIDTLIKDLDTEITEATTEEKLAQEEYEELMSDSAAKRASDSKSVTDKEGVKANTEAALAADEASLKDKKSELMATLEYIASLHAECDWLIKFFDMRKEARAGEIDSMKKAKAVLSGADFSLVQTKEARFLGRA
jgi:chromosome segregation ATPase